METNNRSAGGALTLAGKYYTDEHIFLTEWERIFLQNWLCVGRADQIKEPGQYFLQQVGDENVILLRDYAGDAQAFYNVCRHRGTRICAQSSGQLSQSIQCPYHAWTYALNGRLLGVPNMQSVAGFDKADYPLHAVGVAEWEGFLFINLAVNRRPFHTVYAPLLDKFTRWQIPELKIVHTAVYEVAANWKSIFQNYSECYHCPTLHPALNTLTPYQGASNDLEAGPFLGGPMRLARIGASMTMDGYACAPPLGTLAGEDLALVYYYTLFPTMFLSLHPDYVLTHRLEPLAVDRTRVICDWLFAPDAIAQPNFNPQPAIDFWHMTNSQDWFVCELTQQGVKSRAYVPGPYADLESMIAAFDTEYLRVLGM